MRKIVNAPYLAGIIPLLFCALLHPHPTAAASSKHAVEITEENFDDPARDTIIIRMDGATYRVHEEKYEEKDSNPEIANEGSMYVYNEEGAAYQPDFHLSPDKRWLFVVRKGAHFISFGYLFHRTSAGFVPVHFPGGLRLDEETIRRFSKERTPRPKNGSYYGHMAQFLGWRHGSRALQFWVADPRLEATVDFDLKNRSFRLVSRSYLP